ncbi:MAG: Carboxypeptidase regulatory-like domain [Candidatus Eremiobacteraeota bacterium]|nr:Carboxypeptidase regulatory-like domain [Candidatus Eremiobacteraeota bacterium]
MEQSFGTLRCTLLDRRSSLPLGGARAMCVGRGGRISVLDADLRGAFEASLPEGVYDLVVSARGYLSLTVRGVGVLGGYAQTVTHGLVPGSGVPLEAEPATAVAGYVVDRVGLPVANAAIHVNPAGDAYGTRKPAGSAYTTRTDREGVYVVHGVVPGMYDLAVRAAERTVAFAHLPIAHVRDLLRVDLRVLQL